MILLRPIRAPERRRKPRASGDDPHVEIDGGAMKE